MIFLVGDEHEPQPLRGRERAPVVLLFSHVFHFQLAKLFNSKGPIVFLYVKCLVTLQTRSYRTTALNSVLPVLVPFLHGLERTLVVGVVDLQLGRDGGGAGDEHGGAAGCGAAAAKRVRGPTWAQTHHS